MALINRLPTSGGGKQNIQTMNLQYVFGTSDIKYNVATCGSGLLVITNPLYNDGEVSIDCANAKSYFDVLPGEDIIVPLYGEMEYEIMNGLESIAYVFQTPESNYRVSVTSEELLTCEWTTIRSEGANSIWIVLSAYSGNEYADQYEPRISVSLYYDGASEEVYADTYKTNFSIPMQNADSIEFYNNAQKVIVTVFKLFKNA